MSDNVRESLSALMDGEADELELRRLLKQLPEDSSLLREWERYHLLSAGLHQEVHCRASVDLLPGIHAVLEDEPVPSQGGEERKTVGEFFRYLGQGAIAASVAVVVLVAAESLTNLESNEGSSTAAPLADAGFGYDVEMPVLYNTVGELDPEELSRVASFSGDASSRDQEARERLRQAVYRELEQAASSDRSNRRNEVPVSYSSAGN